jgi:Leucine-rich repeat (LRR) protein
MSNDFPRLPSLDSLRKEAKRWLASLDAHDARERLRRALGEIPDAPTLRDVQLALAREKGFLGWTDLKRAAEPDAITVANALALYKTQAQALLDAYRTGAPDALERHYSFTWHRRAWPALRRYVQGDLGKRGPNPDEIDITLDDARYLVAIEHGFENWNELINAPVRSPRLKLLDPVIDAHGQMTDEMLERVSHLEHVTSLRLSNSKALTDEGIRHLARMPQLRDLDLTQTAVTDRGLEVLRHLPNLESLSLIFTRVTDDGVNHLRDCKSLTRLDLMWTDTGDGAIRALSGKPRLSHFVSGNNITDNGLSALHDLPVFAKWRGGKVEMALLSPQVQPNQLTLRGAISDRGLESLRGLNGLFGLGIDSSLELTRNGIAHLAALPRLGWLSLDAKDDSMPVIASMPALKFLLVQDTTAGDAGFEAVSESQSIEMIWGRSTHNLHKRGFVALSGMPKLRALSVSCLNVDDSGIASLPDFAALRELMPMDIPDAGYRHIGKCSEMESLILMYCRDTTDAATEHIAALRKLRHYFNSYTMITDRTPQILSGIDSLETVTFDACHGLTDDGVAALARLPRLKELRVSGNGLTRAVVKPFPPSVSVHYSP